MICRVEENGGSGDRESYCINNHMREMIKLQVRKEIQKYIIRKRKDNWIMRYLEKEREWPEQF